MKKYIVFTISFMLLFSLLVVSAEILSGVFLTSMHTPDVIEAWNESATLHQQTKIISSSSPFPLILLFALLSVTIAYFISKRYAKRIRNNVE